MVKLVLLSVSVLALMTTSTHAKSLTASVAADGSTCNISPSPKDAYRLLSIATDPTCAANGIGCVSSACRYCRLKRDEKFSNLLICSAIPGFLADGQVFDPSDIIDTGPAFNLACTTTVSSGDAQVGINIVTDVSCTLGGIGCLNDLCRYCKKWETIQSAAFMACTDVDTNNGDDISFSTIPVVTSDPSGPAIGSTDRPTLDVIPLSALTSPITTAPPATMSPTTVPPTLTPTAAPVTLAPTLAPTATPTTVPPTTAPPPTTTAPPVTVPPTVTPTTAPPLTVPPMTTAPPTVAPTTAPPVTAPPMTAPPVTVPPPTVPPPTTKPPTVAPTTAKPPTVAPTTTKPPTVAPTTTKPPTVAPKTTKPPTVAPTTTKPQTVAPPPPTVAPTTASPTTAPPPPTAPPLTTAPSPTIDACAAAVSVGDKNVGVFGFTDPTCQFGGLGCFSTACRFCQGFSTPQSSYLDPCPSTPTTVPPPPTTAPPPPTPAPTRDPCALSVSSGDNNVGISAYTDTLCLSGGLGCFGSTCRFCKTFATPQSEPYLPCPTST